MPWRSSLFLLVLNLLVVALVVAFAPLEKTLGANVRVVYLHGAWVWAAMAAYLTAGLAGLIGLVIRRVEYHRWSLALGRAGLIFWITYLPISMWAMQTNWNGLFLLEPRWRLAIVFAVSGLLLQIGLTLIDRPAWASVSNLGYILFLLAALRFTEDVMHPPSPILNSNAWRIQLYLTVILALVLLAAFQVARWLFARKHFMSD
jgi:hypothetical protein